MLATAAGIEQREDVREHHPDAMQQGLAERVGQGLNQDPCQELYRMSVLVFHQFDLPEIDGVAVGL